MQFAIQYNIVSEGPATPNLAPQLMEADTLPLALRAIQKQLDVLPFDSAIVFVPVRVLRASRRIDITDANGNAIAVDAPLIVDGRTRAPAAPVPQAGEERTAGEEPGEREAPALVAK